MKLKSRHVLILGLGESGLASARWCARAGAKVRVADTRTAPPGLVELKQFVPDAEFVAGEFDKPLLAGIDLLVLSPGLSGGLMIVIHARANGIAVVGEIELFARGLRDHEPPQGLAPLLAITGTNGKTTTTALTGHLLRSTGKTVGVAGNISPAALTALMDFEDAGSLPHIWVLELSSFQLETTESLNATAATVLNVSDDHLDRYIDLDEYAWAKARIFQCRRSHVRDAGVQVLNRQDDRVCRMAYPDRRIISFGIDAPGHEDDFGLRINRNEPWIVQGERFLLPVADVPISGLHNATNAMAALALCTTLGFDANTLLPALRSFRGLPHRVEQVADIDGVRWYDDSKGTNVGATVAALSGLSGLGGHERKIILIAGGDGKGQDFSPLEVAVRDYARAVVLLGRDGPLIEKAIIDADVDTRQASSMADAVAVAHALARPGDLVLLSPACASFDMFRNYEHRAKVFMDAVNALPRKVVA